MKKCFLFSFIKEIQDGSNGLKKASFLVIFFPYKSIKEDTEDIQIQLREYFYENILPDRIIIICPEFNKPEITELFSSDSDIYSYTPLFSPGTANENLSALYINGNGELITFLGENVQIDELDNIYNRGLTCIFNNNGGLIVSKSAHHFVFPSGKHCDRFLRTGNVLLHGAEILFIASSLIKRFKTKRFDSIYCDTSSINSLAFAYINLLKELDPTFESMVQIESFGSYKLFEESKFKAKRNSLFLISSSTSGSILKRMTEDRKKNIDLQNVAIIYGLNVETNYTSQIVCDLSYDFKNNPNGLSPFVSYNINREQCSLCNDGSKPIDVQGDVFLLDKPVVIGLLINKTDAPTYLNKLGPYYKKLKESDDAILKCFYKDDGLNQKKYEIYMDLMQLFLEWPNRKDSKHPYFKVFERLEKLVVQNIPASLKYMIVLSDQSSRKLAEIICEILNEHDLPFSPSNILNTNELKQIEKKITGTIAVISASVASGRNLLFLSRALREFESTYQRLYFTFLNRTPNSGHYEFLESNLGLGEFGKNTHRIINVENIYCSEKAHQTPWHFESNSIKELGEFCDEEGGYSKTLEYCLAREQELNESGLNKGLINNLFFPSVVNNEILKIRKGFAFAPNNVTSFTSKSTQSEIYFIISIILNELRSQGKLVQSEYVRNILDPGNFVRYNDGIIQACFLRSATSDELRYDLTDEMSLKMKSVLGDMIIHIEDYHAEALNEFFYAIAIKKMRLKKQILQECIELLEEQPTYIKADSILKGIIGYIKERVLEKKNVIYDFKTSIEQITV